MIFALCGGDGRQARLAGLLLADGHSVRTWALERAELPEPARRCRSAAEALDGADCLLLPMPVSCLLYTSFCCCRPLAMLMP